MVSGLSLREFAPNLKIGALPMSLIARPLVEISVAAVTLWRFSSRPVSGGRRLLPRWGWGCGDGWRIAVNLLDHGPERRRLFAVSRPVAVMDARGDQALLQI